MKLTPEQEEALVKKYTPYLWAVVWGFCRRRKSGHQPVEDMFQECALVFLKHIRTVGNEEDIIAKMPVRDMIRHMCLFVLEIEPCVSYPKRTAGFNSDMGSTPSCTHLDAIAEAAEDVQAEISMLDVEFDSDFTRFKQLLTPRQAQLMKMKESGMRNHEIVKLLGVTKQTVNACFTDIAKKYKKFIQTAA